MEKTRLGRTNIYVSRTSFGAIPIQRISEEESISILRKAYANGVNFFDTARFYGTSEYRIGKALGDVRKKVVIATKTMAKTGEDLKIELEKSLKELDTDYIDIYQFHNPPFFPQPNEPDGLYDAALEVKKEGKINHIGVSTHNLELAKEMVKSGLIETMQYPINSIATEEEIKLIELCKDYNVGFIAMKAMAGGLISNAKSAFVFLRQFDNVVPIWGIQHMWELEEFLGYEKNPPQLDNEIWDAIYKDRKELADDFCRACGYCMPCQVDINIPMAARMEFLLGRMDVNLYTTGDYKAMMRRINDCTGCGNCEELCPYNLETRALLRRHLEFYENFLLTIK